jgi:hypothetical protein
MFDGRFQSRDIAGHRIPCQVGIYLEVSVNEDVSHARDLMPWNLRRERTDLIRYGSGRFSDDLEMTHEPRLQQFIALERALIAVGVALDRRDRLHSVAQTLGGVSQTGIAS